MSDNTYVWPRELWMRKPKYHDQGVVQAVLSEHATIARYEGDERYVDHHHYIDADIYNSAEAYWKHQNENLMAEVKMLREGLGVIASQQMTHEHYDEEGDFEYAYDMCVSLARAALEGDKP